MRITVVDLGGLMSDMARICATDLGVRLFTKGGVVHAFATDRFAAALARVETSDEVELSIPFAAARRLAGTRRRSVTLVVEGGRVRVEKGIPLSFRPLADDVLPRPDRLSALVPPQGVTKAFQGRYLAAVGAVAVRRKKSVAIALGPTTTGWATFGVGADYRVWVMPLSVSRPTEGWLGG